MICLAGVISTLAVSAVAAPGTASLARARQAWEDGEMGDAEHAYEEAIERGGLDRASTLECYVHLGAARSVVGNKNGALAAFRMAILIDDAFTVPPEAGKKAIAMAESARRQPNRVGSLHLALSVPGDAPSGEAFAVNVMLDAAQAALITRLSLHVKDVTTAKKYDYEEPAGSVVHFRVPASMTLPGASLKIEVDALDAHDNQLAIAEEHVTVRPTPIAELGGRAHPDRDELRPHGSGFWSTAWPWVIGGVALAAGGAVGGYFLLKTPDRVFVEAPTNR